MITSAKISANGSKRPSKSETSTELWLSKDSDSQECHRGRHHNLFMRNVFDQYTQPENRITHALVTALAEDPKLLRAFVRWITGVSAPAGKLHIVEQRLPGEPDEHSEVDAARRGLPDAWIYNDESWCLLIESKIAATLKNDQLHRHQKTAVRRGFEKVNRKRPTIPSVHLNELMPQA